jgi:hypothetical protein
MPQLVEVEGDPEVELIRGSLYNASRAVTKWQEAQREPVRSFGVDPERFSGYLQYLQMIPKFEWLKEKLAEMTALEANWDTYGAEPPGRNALSRAEEILLILRGQSLLPTKVVASSEGGVAICFIEGDRYADIECLNTNETLAVTYRGTDEPVVWEIRNNQDGLRDAIERIYAHFAA